ncbi:hypothetical protein GCM10022381_17430 [Leifsonia kafniensis]|uniref:LPXTG cell wall anchor domain-containing protein n=1 Tax=Leifsonia kafniensis TaxID=475957 RepID=A0ABP7KEY3_9MICO
MPQPLTISTRPVGRIRHGLVRLASVLTASLLIGVGSLAFAAPAHAAPDVDDLLGGLAIGADQGATAFAAPALLAATSPVSGVIDDMTFEADADNVAAGATLTSYTPGTLDVTIPSTVTLNTIIYTVTAIGDYAFSGTGLTAVSIPNTVTSIGQFAFAVNALTTLTLPDSVTTIGSAAFALNQIAELHLGSGVTEIGPVAFILNVLTDLTIPNSVTIINQGAFAYNHLQTITAGSSVTTIGGAAFSSNYLYDPLHLESALFTAENATLKNVTFTGAAPTTIIDITGDGDPVWASFGPFGVLVSYPWAFSTSAALPGGFTSPTWKGYASQAVATVDFELNGHGTAIDGQAIAVDQTATEPTAPSASGFTFGGWFTDAALANEFSFSTAITADTTLYAGWAEIVVPPADTAVVSFEMNGHGTSIADQTVTVGELATKPAAPSASSFTFTGWFTDVALTTEFDFSTAISDDTALYAGWTENAVVPPTPEPTTEPTAAPTAPAPTKPAPAAVLASTGPADFTAALLAAFAALALGGLLIARRRIRSV